MFSINRNQNDFAFHSNQAKRSVTSIEFLEYNQEIKQHLHLMELENQNSFNSLKSQRKLSSMIRYRAVLWIFRAHQRLNLAQETLFLAVHLLDQTYIVSTIDEYKCELVAATSLWIASKYEENWGQSVNVSTLEKLSSGFKRTDFHAMELQILKSVDFKLGFPTAETQLQLIIKTAENHRHHPSSRTRAIARYILEISIFNHLFKRFRPSVLAQCALILAMKMNNQHLLILNQEEFDCIKLLNQGLTSVPQIIYQKYSSPEYSSASIMCKYWQSFY